MNRRRSRIDPQHPEYDITLTKILHVFEAWSTALFFGILALSMLYVIGNLQAFTAATQTVLLQLIQIAGFAGTGVNAYTVLLIILWGIRHRHFMVVRFIFSFVSLLISLALTLGASFIAILVAPH